MVYALWGLSRGTPAALIQLGLSASAHPTAEFVASALERGATAVRRRLPAGPAALGAARRGARRRALREQLAAASGVPDVTERLRRWVGCGLVTASATRTYRSRAARWTRPSGACRNAVRSWWRRRDLGPAPPERRARRGWHGGAVPDAPGGGPPGTGVACRARLGAVLDGAYAAAGRWDAWHSCLLATLEAARAVGDQADGGHGPAPARHRRARPRRPGGGLRPALRRARHPRGAGHTAAAAVTRQNLATITAARREPPVAVVLGRIPTPVKAVAVLLPLLGSLAFVGLAQAGSTPAARLDPQQLAFVDQVVDKVSAPQVFRLTNDGPATLHVDNVAVAGPTTARSRWSTRAASARCPRAVGAPRRSCSRPRPPGEQRASLSWQIREIPGGITAPIVGTGVEHRRPRSRWPSTPPCSRSTPRRRARPARRSSVRVVAGSTPLRSRRPPHRATSRSTATAARAPCSRPAPSASWPSGSRRALRASAPRSSPWPTRTAVRRPSVSLRGTGRRAAPARSRGDTACRSASATRRSAPHRRRRRVTFTNRGGAPSDLGAVTIAGARGFAVFDNCPGRARPGAGVHGDRHVRAVGCGAA